MTTIAPEAPTRSSELALAADALATLARVPGLTPPCLWEIAARTGMPVEIRAQISPTSLPELIERMRLYADVLDGVMWDVENYHPHQRGGQLNIAGTYGGVHVNVWAGLKCCDLDEAVRLVAAAT
ncbi:hypothetical protein ITP53_11500 [Nonomuraea sp. K274]|uniref:Uncharacterized protein n=1 Tax=Nonomuraea cypriaca TaxID=1187855 RepID=A0A931EW58_9ACTN|nr:hypothetical protein [Nonomuraea cypriaca]MBF8186364.1 hypothetical protein [Nonomuraea cypriaca]